MTFIFSSITNSVPICPNNSKIVVTSFRCGTFFINTECGVSKDAANIGSAEVLAPEILTSPYNGVPPFIINLSIVIFSILHV